MCNMCAIHVCKWNGYFIEYKRNLKTSAYQSKLSRKSTWRKWHNFISQWHWSRTFRLFAHGSWSFLTDHVYYSTKKCCYHDEIQINSSDELIWMKQKRCGWIWWWYYSIQDCTNVMELFPRLFSDSFLTSNITPNCRLLFAYPIH